MQDYDDLANAIEIALSGTRAQPIESLAARQLNNAHEFSKECSGFQLCSALSPRQRTWLSVLPIVN
jgi:hypothetical protein